MNKHGVAFGINYQGTQNELNGCLRDAEYWASQMNTANVKPLPWMPTNAVLEKKATKVEIIKTIEWIFAQTTPGDRVFIMYSGHGTIVPPGIQSLVPYDFNWEKPSTWLTYDEIDHLLVEHTKSEVRVLLLFDSCHSAADPRKHMRDLNHSKIKSRYLTPPQRMLKMLLGNPFHRNMITAEDQFATLLAGCRREQTSADAEIGGEYWGAFTYSCRKVLTHKLTANSIEIVHGAQAYLNENGYDQVPQACGDPEDLQEPFWG